MTSVLYGAGLNYQAGNPIRAEFGKVNNTIADLRKLVESQVSDLKTLKQRVESLETENNTLKSTLSRIDSAQKILTS